MFIYLNVFLAKPLNIDYSNLLLRGYFTINALIYNLEQMQDLYTIVEEHPNFVIFRDLENRLMLYERLMGTMHDISNDSSLVLEIKGVNKPTRFDLSMSLLETELKSDWDTLILEATQDCNLRCGYCIYGGNYSGERVHSIEKKDMPLDIAIKAIDLFSLHAKTNPHVYL